MFCYFFYFFFQAEDGIRDHCVTGVQTCALPIYVVKLFEVVVKDPARQIAYYDPGVGTLSVPGFVTFMGKWLSIGMGLAFGYGITRNIEDAYAYLMARYEYGDKVFLFGFSRGAFTARAL